jgi:hypothetical protein
MPADVEDALRPIRFLLSTRIFALPEIIMPDQSLLLLIT